DDRRSGLELWDPRFGTPYSQQFNLAVQRELFHNTVVEIAYIGNRGMKLLTKVNLNQSKIHNGFLQALKKFKHSGPTTLRYRPKIIWSAFLARPTLPSPRLAPASSTPGKLAPQRRLWT